METTETNQDLGNLLGDWHVYVLADRNMFAGKLEVYDQGVHFWSSDDLKSDAIAVTGALTFGIGVAKRSYKDFTLNYKEITNVEIIKKYLIMQNLVITTNMGEKLTFRFGMLSPKKALDAIRMKMG